jgi:hypothetical protein
MPTQGMPQDLRQIQQDLGKYQMAMQQQQPPPPLQNISSKQANPLPNLSQEDNALVVYLTNMLMAQSSDEQKTELRASLQARMIPEIYQKYISQGQDPLFLYFRNQALNRLRAEKQARLAQIHQLAISQQHQPQSQNISLSAPLSKRKGTNATALSAPSKIAQLRKSSESLPAPMENSDAMNLDDFIFSDSISAPAGLGISPSLELGKKESEKSSNPVASAIPIKMRKETPQFAVPQSVPVQHHPMKQKGSEPEPFEWPGPGPTLPSRDSMQYQPDLATLQPSSYQKPASVGPEYNHNPAVASGRPTVNTNMSLHKGETFHSSSTTPERNFSHGFEVPSFPRRAAAPAFTSYPLYPVSGMLKLGVQNGDYFYCQYGRYQALGGLCNELCIDGEQLQTHFEQQHGSFTRIEEPYRAICSFCKSLNGYALGACPGCGRKGLIQVWVCGKSIRSRTTLDDVVDAHKSRATIALGNIDQSQPLDSQPSAAEQQQKQTHELPLFKPEQMRDLPEDSYFTGEVKLKWEKGLAVLWEYIEKFGPETPNHQEARKRLIQFSRFLWMKLKPADIARVQDQQQQNGPVQMMANANRDIPRNAASQLSAVAGGSSQVGQLNNLVRPENDIISDALLTGIGGSNQYWTSHNSGVSGADPILFKQEDEYDILSTQ